MKNPPDFVMYVVMVKLPGSDKFDPYWLSSVGTRYARGFAARSVAEIALKRVQKLCGKKNAYIQQYGPYS